jgi:hypothetical protein
MDTRGRKPKGEFAGKSAALATRITPDRRNSRKPRRKMNVRYLKRLNFGWQNAGDLEDEPHTGQMRALIQRDR